MKAIKAIFATIAMAASMAANAFDPSEILTIEYNRKHFMDQGKYTKQQQQEMLDYLQDAMHELHHFTSQASQDAMVLDTDLKKAGYKDLRQVKPGTNLYQRLHEDVAPRLKDLNGQATKLWQAVTIFNEIRWNSPECKGKTKCKQLVYDIYNGSDDNETDLMEGTMFMNYDDLRVTVPYNPRVKVLNENQAVELSNKM